MTAGCLITRLNTLQNQQEELTEKLFEHYDSYTFLHDNLIEHEGNLFFQIIEGILSGHCIEVDGDEYNFIIGNQVSDLNQLYFFIYTPENTPNILY